MHKRDRRSKERRAKARVVARHIHRVARDIGSVYAVVRPFSRHRDRDRAGTGADVDRDASGLEAGFVEHEIDQLLRLGSRN